MNDPSEEEAMLEILYGPLAPYSDHKRGEHIRFREEGQEQTGEIIWVRQSGPAVQGGKSHPVCYIVDTGGEGMPSMVYPGEVVE